MKKEDVPKIGEVLARSKSGQLALLVFGVITSCCLAAGAAFVIAANSLR